MTATPEWVMEIARRHWPKESQPDDDPAEWFIDAIKEAVRSGDALKAAPASPSHETDGDCGYQDVECWERQLRAAGWLPWNLRRNQESSSSTTWKSPKGQFYRGPFGAWWVMKSNAGALVHVSGTATADDVQPVVNELLRRMESGESGLEVAPAPRPEQET
jgi:hypothetical protein